MCQTPFRARSEELQSLQLSFLYFFSRWETLDLGLQMRTKTQSEDVSRTMILLHLTRLSANPHTGAFGRRQQPLSPLGLMDATPLPSPRPAARSGAGAPKIIPSEERTAHAAGVVPGVQVPLGRTRGERERERERARRKWEIQRGKEACKVEDFRLRVVSDFRLWAPFWI